MCKRPLGHRKGQALAGLMTLQNFIDGGHEVTDARVIVIVKSLGVKKPGILADTLWSFTELTSPSGTQRPERYGTHQPAGS